MHFSVVLDFRGGRRNEHILTMAQQASDFDFVVVLVGNNDISCSKTAAIIQNIRTFASAVGVEKFRVIALFYRKDNRASAVNRLNQMLREEFPENYFPNKFVKLKDFWDNDPAHLNEFGQQHLSQLIKWCSDRLNRNDLSRV